MKEARKGGLIYDYHRCVMMDGEQIYIRDVFQFDQSCILKKRYNAIFNQGADVSRLAAKMRDKGLIDDAKAVSLEVLGINYEMAKHPGIRLEIDGDSSVWDMALLFHLRHGHLHCGHAAARIAAQNLADADFYEVASAIPIRSWDGKAAGDISVFEIRGLDYAARSAFVLACLIGVVNGTYSGDFFPEVHGQLIPVSEIEIFECSKHILTDKKTPF